MVDVSIVQGLAQEAASWFESAYRVEGDECTRYVRTRDGRPEWLQELCFVAHGDMFPDDWRYACIRAAVEFIAEGVDPEDGQGEFADGYVDVYTAARTAWLASHLARVGYCDEARDEFGGEGLDLIEQVGQGQYLEASEVFGLVLGFLSSRAGVEA